MSSAERPAVQLARRLRELRKEHWPGRTLTQAQLAEAFAQAPGGSGTLSAPSISSWENVNQPKTPPAERIETYALFFATERSVEREPYRVVELTELTPAERERRDQLHAELRSLRDAAMRPSSRRASQSGDTPAEEGLLSFPLGEDVAIVCASLPEEMQVNIQHAAPQGPDSVNLYRYADIDALFELYGRLRELNPNGSVRRLTSDELTADDYNSHLILLGGVDWNSATRDLFERVELPVRQKGRDETWDVGGFEADINGRPRRFVPTVTGQAQLMEDVAHCYIGQSPYNPSRTIMLFNGMHGRGTFGAVRALTDPELRDRNEAYAREGMDRQGEWSLLMRVLSVGSVGVTPDWTDAQTRLHEWPVD